MPYIMTMRREAINGGALPLNCGELNYAFTTMIINTDIRDTDQGRKLRQAILQKCSEYVTAFGIKYQNINDVIGALDGASREFKRRKWPFTYEQALLRSVADEFYATTAAPYEDAKIIANGDIKYA